jgi:3,5-epimerase/4-reductase
MFIAGIHMTLYATGCIYEYDDDHTIGGMGFSEECPPNYVGMLLSSTWQFASHSERLKSKAVNGD